MQLDAISYFNFGSCLVRSLMRFDIPNLGGLICDAMLNFIYQMWELFA